MVYKTTVNGFTPLESGSTIVNEVVEDSDTLSAPITASEADTV